MWRRRSLLFLGMLVTIASTDASNVENKNHDSDGHTTRTRKPSGRSYLQRRRQQEEEENDAQSTYTPVFMFAGQSNIVGHPNEAACEYTKETGMGQCYLGEPVVFDAYAATGTTPEDIRGQDLKRLVDILGDGNSGELPYKKTLEQLRDTALLRVGPPHSDHVEIAEWEAASLLNLKNKYPTLLSDMLTRESDHVYCSWTFPAPVGGDTDLDEGEKLSVNAGCGGPWGLEQSFGHTFPTFGKDADFAIVKVAEGGTTMKYDWTKSDAETGHCWDAFVKQARNIDGAHPNCPRQADDNNIEGPPCRWQGLVFFQGENDAFLETTDAKLYGLRLKNFIDAAREELFLGGADPFYKSAEEIPVVIVQLGCWPAGLNTKNGQVIMRRQKQFVKRDANATLVKTDDLSCFYHFDTASHVLIGERVAMAMDGLLKQQRQHNGGDGLTMAMESASFGCSSIKNDLCYTDEDCCKPLTCNKLHRCKPTEGHRERAPLISNIFNRGTRVSDGRMGMAP